MVMLNICLYILNQNLTPNTLNTLNLTKCPRYTMSLFLIAEKANPHKATWVLHCDIVQGRIRMFSVGNCNKLPAESLSWSIFNPMSKTSIWCDLIWKISSVELVKTIPLQEIEEMFIFIRPWQNNYATY